MVTSWPYDHLRIADGGQGTLRLKCISASLARLEGIRPRVQEEIRTRSKFLIADRGGGADPPHCRLVASRNRIHCTIVAVFGVPLVADRLVPLIPFSFERRLGDIGDNQVKAIFGGKTCTDREGRCRLSQNLSKRYARRATSNRPLQTAVLASPIPNAFALPGGRIYLLNGLLQKANNADEVAGVIAHEMGHVSSSRPDAYADPAGRHRAS